MRFGGGVDQLIARCPFPVSLKTNKNNREKTMKKKIVISGVLLAVLAIGAFAISVAAAPPGKPPIMESGTGVGSAYFNYPQIRHVSLTLVANGASATVGSDQVFVMVSTGPYGWTILPITGNGNGVVQFDAQSWDIMVIDQLPQTYDVRYSWTTTRPGG
jgi:hypothetical protein